MVKCQVLCEIVGEENDPMTAQREEIFKPLGIALSKQLEAATGKVSGATLEMHPSPKTHREMIESKLIPCEHCGKMVAMLIFAPEATDAGHFEDYARKMYDQYSLLDLPTWIIGPGLGSGPIEDRQSEVFKVWPERRPRERMRPAEFNPLINKLAETHCI